MARTPCGHPVSLRPCVRAWAHHRRGSHDMGHVCGPAPLHAEPSYCFGSLSVAGMSVGSSKWWPNTHFQTHSAPGASGARQFTPGQPIPSSQAGPFTSRKGHPPCPLGNAERYSMRGYRGHSGSPENGRRDLRPKLWQGPRWPGPCGSSHVISSPPELRAPPFGPRIDFLPLYTPPPVNPEILPLPPSRRRHGRDAKGQKQHSHYCSAAVGVSRAGPPPLAFFFLNPPP